MEGNAPARPVKPTWKRACGNCDNAAEFTDTEVAKTYVYCTLFKDRRDRQFMTCMRDFKKA